MASEQELYAFSAARAEAAMQAQDWTVAARWWERAWRHSGGQTVPSLQLAGALTRLNDARAIQLFADAARTHESFPVLLALVGALERAGRGREAIAALDRLLKSVAVDAVSAAAGLAARLAAQADRVGWLGWSGGRLLFGRADRYGGDPDALAFMGGRARLPLQWTVEQEGVWSAPAPHVTAIDAGVALLGAPLRPGRFLQIEGIAERTASGVRGMAWYPRDPSRPPALTIESDVEGRATIGVTALQAGEPSPAQLFVVPWEFAQPLAAESRLRRVGTEAGELALAEAAGGAVFRAGHTGSGSAVCVIAGLEAGERATAASATWLGALGADAVVQVPPGQGFAAAWNAAARDQAQADLVIVIGGARLWPGALERLREAATDHGFAVPLTNRAGAAGYPSTAEDVGLEVEAAGAIAAAVARVAAAPIAAAAPAPRAAIFIRRACFEAVGGFCEGKLLSAEATLEAFSRRAVQCGFDGAVAASVFAWSADRPTGSALLRERIERHDRAVLAALFGASAELPVDFGRAARRAIDAARLEATLAGSPCVLLVTHDEGGGVERHVQDRVRTLRRDGTAGLLLRSRAASPAEVQLALSPHVLEHLSFRLPSELPELLQLLEGLTITRIEYHQLRLHPGVVRDLPARLAVPFEVVLHDYGLMCPRVTLLDARGRYCGEPAIEACEACAAEYDTAPAAVVRDVRALRGTSAALLQAADQVTAPSMDIARRFAREFPAIRVATRRWEAPIRLRRPVIATEDVPTVCVVGAISRAKGFEILLACARDVVVRALDLRFVVVGHTIDDAALLEAGCFVTGPYAEDERAELIGRQQAAAGFVPSIWPEPWCYALSGLLAAGLPTLCFDIGAQADRVRGAGGVVLPLDATAAEVNERLTSLVV